MSPLPSVTRREFLKTSAATGAGLVIAFHLPGNNARAADDERNPSDPNAWLAIKPDGTIEFTFDKTELGQGTMTAFGMILAEELSADWEQMRFGHTPVNPAGWVRGMSTGGSTGVRTSWEMLRKAGASAREMLITAAAETWGVERGACKAEKGAVVHNDQRLTYAELTGKATTLAVPSDPPLKNSGEFTILGTPLKRLDAPSKVDGTALYGSDLTVPGMLVATVERSPILAGKVMNFNDDAARATPGVKDVISLEGTFDVPANGKWPAPIESGIAVVADTARQALAGRRALVIEWQGGKAPDLTSAKISEQFAELAKGEATEARKDGDADTALGQAAKTIEAVYEVPYLAHAPMEPMNCIAHFKEHECTVWAPTQNQTEVQRVAAEVSGLPMEAVTVYTPLVGGGFGRRLESDFIAEAVQISKAVGAPIKLIWTREDDMKHDFYRPASYSELRAGVDADGKLTAWKQRVVTPPIGTKWGPLRDGLDRSALHGLADIPYGIANFYLDYVAADLPVPLGFWRSVGYSQNAFVVEGFLDEIAEVAGRDPLELRRELLADQPRMLAALDLAAEKAGWGSAPAVGRARGIGLAACFGSFSAQIAEVSVDADEKVKVHRIVCAIDCGPVANPDLLATQVEGGVAFGLSAALYGEITIDKGGVKQTNFDDYRILKMSEMPVVETHIVPSEDTQGGIGEPGVPPVAPAVANAVSKATGKRVRKLPIMSTVT
jgi:isoquinoline 1-oxidoreductase beta subunit